MSKSTQLISEEELENLKSKIEDRIKKLPNLDEKQLKFEEGRVRQILQRNIPMYISLHVKNIVQTDNPDKIIGQLERLNVEAYWKKMNLEYLQLVKNKLKKI